MRVHAKRLRQGAKAERRDEAGVRHAVRTHCSFHRDKALRVGSRARLWECASRCDANVRRARPGPAPRCHRCWSASAVRPTGQRPMAAGVCYEDHWAAPRMFTMQTVQQPVEVLACWCPQLLLASPSTLSTAWYLSFTDGRRTCPLVARLFLLPGCRSRCWWRRFFFPRRVPRHSTSAPMTRTGRKQPTPAQLPACSCEAR